jgi:Flp pilus assembly protein TadD
MEILANTEVIPPALLPRVLSLLESVLHRYPNDGTLLLDYTMAKSRRWSGEKDAVPSGFVEAITKASVLNPRLSQAFFVLGLVDAQNGDYRTAVTHFKKAIALKPDKDEYHYHLSFAYRQTGSEPGAQEEMRLFRELHKQNSTPAK